MFSLAQSVFVKGGTGEPIPSPLTGLDRFNVVFRRGEFSIICAAGGTGKSLLGLFLAVFSGVPCLYMSADSTAAVQMARAAAMITGDDVHEIRELVSTGEFYARYREVLARQWLLRFCYSARPTPADMELHLKCYKEVFGCHPYMVVVDNISNVDFGSGTSASDYVFGLEGLCDYLSEMARETGAHVLAMHHVVGEYSSGNIPVPLSGVKGKIARVPALVLTMFAEFDGVEGRVLNVSPVKNRSGFSDPTGGTCARFLVDPVNLRIRDVPEGGF